MTATSTDMDIPVEKLRVLSEEELLRLGVTDEKIVQRALRYRRVVDMANNWEPTHLGQCTVSERPNGDLILLDGQHRRAAIVLRQARDEEVQGTLNCRVWAGLTREEEANMFLGLNNTAVPTPLDKFVVLDTAGDESVKKINDIVRRYGVKVSHQPGKSTIQAVKTLVAVMDESEKIEADPNLIDATLQVISNAWELEGSALKGAVVQGIAWFIAEYADKLNLKTLSERLARFPGGATTLLANAQANAKVRGVKVHLSVADLLTNYWNKHSRTEKLPVWTRTK